MKYQSSVDQRYCSRVLISTLSQMPLVNLTQLVDSIIFQCAILGFGVTHFNRGENGSGPA